MHLVVVVGFLPGQVVLLNGGTFLVLLSLVMRSAIYYTDSLTAAFERRLGLSGTGLDVWSMDSFLARFFIEEIICKPTREAYRLCRWEIYALAVDET
jgi:hypothetical protein